MGSWRAAVTRIPPLVMPKVLNGQEARRGPPRRLRRRFLRRPKLVFLYVDDLIFVTVDRPPRLAGFLVPCGLRFTNASSWPGAMPRGEIHATRETTWTLHSGRKGTERNELNFPWPLTDFLDLRSLRWAIVTDLPELVTPVEIHRVIFLMVL